MQVSSSCFQVVSGPGRGCAEPSVPVQSQNTWERGPPRSTSHGHASPPGQGQTCCSLFPNECLPVGPLVPREQSKPEGMTPSQAGGQPGWASLTFCPSVKHGIHQCCPREPRVGGHQWASELSKQAGLLKEARSLEAAASGGKSSDQPHSDLSSAIAKALLTQCQVTERASTLKLDGTGLESQLP